MAKHFATDVDTAAFFEDEESFDVEPVVTTIDTVEEPFIAEAVMVPVEPLDDSRGIPMWLDLLLTALITVAVVVAMRIFVADTYQVPTGSMLETIQLGDRLIGEKVSYRFRAPKAGEVVTFDDPSDPSVTLIKRVIATEGQTVDLVDGVVVVDGEALDEPYVLDKPSEPIDRFAPELSEPITYPYVVPEGCVWVMGDNRTNSLDSRYFGAVEINTVSSRALFIFWPFSDARTL